jgi:hypothetical protein
MILHASLEYLQMIVRHLNKINLSNSTNADAIDQNIDVDEMQ